MRRTLDLWLLIVIIAMITAGFNSVKAALPFALEFLEVSVLVFAGLGVIIVFDWYMQRRKSPERYVHEVYRRFGWLLWSWVAAGWWYVAVDAGALGASLTLSPVMLLAGVLLTIGKKQSG